MLKNVLVISQIILSSLLIVQILIQARGTGIGRSFGGGNTSFTRRGMEKVVFKSTFVVTGLFIVVSIVALAL